MKSKVEWYPWGEVALQKARRDGKPVFLSIGYAVCHWRHVMTHESFEDQFQTHSNLGSKASELFGYSARRFSSFSTTLLNKVT